MPFPSKEIINIYFKNGIEDIGEGAFSTCRNLVSNELVLPNSVRHIGNKAFSQISPVKDLDGNDLMLYIKFPKRRIYLKVWQINVGRIKLYLLDSDIDENSPEDREVTLR